MKPLNMIEQINIACDELRIALLAEYEASQMELESKVAKQKTHNDVLIAKDTIRDLTIF